MSRIPQLMSKPMPPGEITPESARKAATPPIGKPYPQCPSGMQRDARTMPGRQATLVTCSNTPSSICSSSGPEAYRRAGTSMPGFAVGGISQMQSSTR